MNDTINGGFELIGAFFTWMNAFRLYKDREVRGVWWPIWGFFSTWGIWNLYYYPSLGQWLSFIGGCALVLGNVTWTAMAACLWPSRR